MPERVHQVTKPGWAKKPFFGRSHWPTWFDHCCPSWMMHPTISKQLTVYPPNIHNKSVSNLSDRPDCDILSISLWKKFHLPKLICKKSLLPYQGKRERHHSLVWFFYPWNAESAKKGPLPETHEMSLKNKSHWRRKLNKFPLDSGVAGWVEV